MAVTSTALGYPHCSVLTSAALPLCALIPASAQIQPYQQAALYFFKVLCMCCTCVRKFSCVHMQAAHRRLGPSSITPPT